MAADINVVRKTPRVFPWVIGLGLIVLIAVLWISWDRDTDASAKVPEEVAAYLSFTESSGTIAAGPSHDYAATGIRRLSEALRAVAGREPPANERISEQLEIFQEKADRLQADSSSLNHANIVRDVFVAAVDTMELVQESRSAESTALKSRLAELRQSAENIDRGRPLLDQEDRVTQFFNQSAQTLTMLAKS